MFICTLYDNVQTSYTAQHFKISLNPWAKAIKENKQMLKIWKAAWFLILSKLCTNHEKSNRKYKCQIQPVLEIKSINSVQDFDFKKAPLQTSTSNWQEVDTRDKQWEFYRHRIEFKQQSHIFKISETKSYLQWNKMNEWMNEILRKWQFRVYEKICIWTIKR